MEELCQIAKASQYLGLGMAPTILLHSPRRCLSTKTMMVDTRAAIPLLQMGRSNFLRTARTRLPERQCEWKKPTDGHSRQRTIDRIREPRRRGDEVGRVFAPVRAAEDPERGAGRGGGNNEGNPAASAAAIANSDAYRLRARQAGHYAHCAGHPRSSVLH